jgi:hypothetical protein
MKTRIEVNDNGEFFIIIPEDVLLEYELGVGEQLEWDIDDPDFITLNI